jgi:hypothetical protein
MSCFRTSRRPSSEYDVTEDRSAEDLLALVADLERNGLITVS